MKKVKPQRVGRGISMPRWKLHYLLFLIPLVALIQLFVLRSGTPNTAQSCISVIVPVRTQELPADFFSGLLFNCSEPIEIIVVAYNFLNLREIQQTNSRFGVRVIGATPHGTVFRKQVPTFAEMVNLGIQSMSAASHMALVLSPTHIPVTPDFVGTMKRQLADANAAIISCTTTSVDGEGTLHIRDRGFNITVARENGRLKPFAARNYAGFSERDARTRLVEVVDMAGPYCAMFSQKALQRLHGLPFASEGTSVDAVVNGEVDAHTIKSAAELLRTRLAKLEEVLSTVSVGALKEAKESTKSAVRDTYAVIVDAQKVLKQVVGEDWMKQPLSALDAEVSKQEEEYQGNLNSMAVADRLRYMSNLVESVAAVLKRIHQSKGTMSPEDIYGWALSLSVEKARLGPILVSPARALFNAEAVPQLLRDFFKASPQSANKPSYPLTSGFIAEQYVEELKKHPALKATSAPMRIIWDAFCCNCCGFSNEIVHFIYPLQKLFDLSLVPESSCFCPGFPAAVEDTVSRTHMNRDNFPVEHGANDEIVVWVSHTDPMSYKNAIFDKRKPDYIVGRSMYEFTKIDSNWVEAANTNCDEIWVPAQFVGKVFGSSGVDRSKLVVVPEAVDTYFFDPSAHGTLRLPPAGNITGSWRHWCNFNGERVGSNYKFLSVFKWEPRKGWDVMLKAYFSAFSKSDAVSLYLLTHIWFSGGPETYGDKHNTTYIQEEILKVLGLKSLDNLPHFCIICTDMSETDVARLYNTVDAFVLPTFGEGWGLPAIQAMSMGLPTITTAWGGQLEFLRHFNSLMIGIDGVEEIPSDSVYRWRLGKKWAIPSLNETRRLMRLVFDKPQKGVEIGAAARRHIVQYFSEEAIAKTVSDRLSVIREIVLKRRAQKNSPQK